MTLIATDGYEYQDLTQRLLGRPLENDRNRQVRRLRAAGYCPKEIEAWHTAYDLRTGRHPDKDSSGWKAIDKHRRKQSKAA